MAAGTSSGIGDVGGAEEVLPIRRTGCLWRVRVAGSFVFDEQEISFAEVSRPMKLHGVAKADQKIEVCVRNCDVQSPTIAEFRLAGTLLPYDDDYYTIVTEGVKVCEEK